MAQDASGASRSQEDIAPSTTLHRSTTFPRPNLREHGALHRQPSRPSITRRRSSIFSDSTESLLLPVPAGPGAAKDKAEHEPSHWQSVPLAFALLPALGGLFIKDGSALITDILLLGLSAIFLNWSVRLPWHWYHSARAVQYVEPSTIPMEAISEESSAEEDDGEDWKRREPSPKSAPAERDTLQRHSKAHTAATEELRSHEVTALALCFLGPMMGAYLLHAIRAQLSRPSEGLVSTFNLTIFLLAAELRPASHLVKMMQQRTLYLQKLVSADAKPDDIADKEQIMDLSTRLTELEASFVDVVSGNKPGKSGKDENLADVVNNVRRDLQPQLDALNRAVRRYEKRATAQTIQTEARLQDLDARVRDALSLAAAAAQRSSKPGTVSFFLDTITTMAMLPVQALWAVSIYPLQVAANAVMTVKTRVIGPTPSKRKSARSKGEIVSRSRGKMALERG